MDRKQRRALLATPPPEVRWQGEPALGAWYTDEEIAAAVDAMRDSMDWNVGFYALEETERFEAAFAAYIGTDHAIAINGAGTGLDMAMMCLDLEPGDEVISCAINFPGTHLAILGQGARLVLSEPDPDTLNIDPVDLERRMTVRTRAIVVTHMNGISADMDAVLEVAERNPHPKYGPPVVIGDAARACGATYKGARVGKAGWMTIFSFQSKKLMTTLGEGGVITTDDADLAGRLRRYRSFGHGITWGTNYKMTKVQAAVGLVQLRRLDAMNAQRIQRARERTAYLESCAELRLPVEPPGYGHVYYLYTMQVPPDWAGRKRDLLIQLMAERYNIGCSTANPPTYTKNQLIRELTRGQRVPRADALGASVLSPALHPCMTEEQNAYVAAALLELVDELHQLPASGTR